MMARMERGMRGECVATVLCGVTDGDSKRQTELSERGEEDMPVLQPPASRYDSGTLAMPCPFPPSYSHQEKHIAFDLIWRLLDTSSHNFSGSTSRGNSIRKEPKSKTRVSEISPLQQGYGG